MNHPIPRRHALLALAIAALVTPDPALAQKVPIDAELTLQLHDLRSIDRPVDPDLPAAERPRLAPDRFEHLAEFARRFVEPPLQPGQDIELLGPHRLAILGTPQQCGWIEGFVRRCAEERAAMITVDVRLVHVTPDQFAAHLDDVLGEPEAGAADGRRGAVLDERTLSKLYDRLAGAGELDSVAAPRLLAYNAQRVSMQVGREIPYVGDFRVATVDGERVVEPVREHLFDGTRIEAVVVILGNDRIGIDCRTLHAEVEQPLPRATVEFSPDDRRTIDLPKPREIEFAQRLELPAGSASVVAVQRANGGWLLAVVGAARFR